MGKKTKIVRFDLGQIFRFGPNEIIQEMEADTELAKRNEQLGKHIPPGSSKVPLEDVEKLSQVNSKANARQ